MSRIFEALTKRESTAAKVALPLVSELQSEIAQPVLPAEPRELAADVPCKEAQACEDDLRVRTEMIQIPPGAAILPFDGSDSHAAEQYRIIRTKIEHHAARPRMVLVSSSMPGDGKTISAINLAASMALRGGMNVLLVDADLRRSSLGKVLGMTGGRGLIDVLKGSSRLDEALVRTEQLPNLYLLPAGESAPDGAELLASERFKNLMEVIRTKFDYAIFDAPPVGAVADYDLLEVACDGTVLVVRQDFTNRTLFRRTLASVPPGKQLGVILNCTEEWFLWKTNSYYYYSRESK